MANPALSEKYKSDPDVRIDIVSGLSSLQNSGISGTISPTTIPRFLQPDLFDTSALSTCDFLDRIIPFTGWQSTQRIYPVSLLLYKPQGWGRNLDITIDATAGVGTVGVDFHGYLFGSYSGDFSYRKSYAPNYFPAAGATPMFPFAPTAIPLYEF